jgi:hypothetical protein
MKKRYIIESDIELQNHEEENFDVLCYDGRAIAVSLKDNNKAIDLVYPKMNMLTANEIDMVRNYRGLPLNEEIHFGDVMMLFGKEREEKCPVCLSERTRRDLDNPQTMRCCNNCGSDYTTDKEILLNARELK